MASIQKTATGWRAQIDKKGVRLSRVCRTKSEAQAWAAAQESLIEQRKVLGGAKRATFGAALGRYVEEVSPRKKGHRWEELRIRRLCGYETLTRRVEPDPLASVMLGDLNETHFADWRDRRLKSVSPATVRREWALLSEVCSTAVKEWKWMHHNPMSDVRMPKKPGRRKRMPTVDEVDRILHVSGYRPDQPCLTKQQLVVAAFLWACECGMRASEILSLGPEQIVRNTARLTTSKNGDERDVPIFAPMRRILAQLPEGLWQGVTDRSRDALWRKMCRLAAVENLHFHDSRHYAITRLCKMRNAKGNPMFTALEVARIVGHRNLNELMTYYEEDVEELATRT